MQPKIGTTKHCEKRLLVKTLRLFVICLLREQIFRLLTMKG